MNNHGRFKQRMINQGNAVTDSDGTPSSGFKQGDVVSTVRAATAWARKNPDPCGFNRNRYSKAKKP